MSSLKVTVVISGKAVIDERQYVIGIKSSDPRTRQA